jgi:hypothetical protein
MKFNTGKTYQFLGSLADAPSFYSQNNVSTRTLKLNEIFIILKFYELKKANRGWFQVLICTDLGEVGKIWVDNNESDDFLYQSY